MHPSQRAFWEEKKLPVEILGHSLIGRNKAAQKTKWYGKSLPFPGLQTTHHWQKMTGQFRRPVIINVQMTRRVYTGHNVYLQRTKCVCTEDRVDMYSRPQRTTRVYTEECYSSHDTVLNLVRRFQYHVSSLSNIGSCMTSRITINDMLHPCGHSFSQYYMSRLNIFCKKDCYNF